MTAAGGAAAGAVATGTLKGAAQGALTALAFWGTGIAANKMASASGGDTYRLGRAFLHGVTGGVLSTLHGGKFGHGFVQAGLGKALSSNIQFETSSADFLSAVLIGGSISEATGGKFANGAVTAAIQYALNEQQWAEFERIIEDRRTLNRVWRQIEELNEDQFDALFPEIYMEAGYNLDVALSSIQAEIYGDMGNALLSTARGIAKQYPRDTLFSIITRSGAALGLSSRTGKVFTALAEVNSFRELHSVADLSSLASRVQSDLATEWRAFRQHGNRSPQ